MSNLEYGRTELFETAEKTIRRLGLTAGRIRRICLIVFLVVMAVFTTQVYRASTVPEASDLLYNTNAERVYKPFEFSLEVHAPVRTYEYQLLHSYLNVGLQLRNLAEFTDYVRAKLEGQTCLHARYFNVPYNIIVYENVTMVNPTVVESSSYSSAEFVRGPLGEEGRVVYPRSMRVRYLTGDTLQWAASTLTGHGALCLYYYLRGGGAEP